MFEINMMSTILMDTVRLITYIVMANALLLILTLVLLKRDIITYRDKNKIVVILTAIVVILSIYFSRDYAGIYDTLKVLFIIIILAFVGIFNALVYLKGVHVTQEQCKKSMAFLLIIWFFLCIPTIVIIEGAFPPYDEERNWNSMNDVFEINSTSYNITMQMDTQAIATKGFFAKTPIIVGIYDGYVNDTAHNLSKNDTITATLSLSHHPYYPENNTMISNFKKFELIYDTDSKFVLKEEDKGGAWLLSYSYSGEKTLIIQTYVNGNVKSTLRKPLVTIEKGYVRAQVDMSRAIIVIAIWTIFASLYKPITKVVEWWIH